MKILDCTLRDGGYYNKWDFPLGEAMQLIKALAMSGVDLIELGYKSLSNDKFYGLFRYCQDDMLDAVPEAGNAQYVFMVDVKEFVDENGRIRSQELDTVVRDRNASIFSGVRLASYFHTLGSVPALVEYFADRGYDVYFNLMGGSLISTDQLKTALETIEKTSAQSFYLADSFGSFYPEDVVRYIRLIRKCYGGSLGLHLHDNQGIAYANALAAVNEGVEYLDMTVCGMGRGAGNLATEQFLQGAKEKLGMSHLKPHSLLPVINSYIMPLKAKYRWGHSYTYMLSGLNNIHPTYCQELGDENRYTMEQMHHILESIPLESRTKFNRQTMSDAIRSGLAQSEERNDLIDLPKRPRDTFPRVLVAAQGPNALAHKPALLRLLEKNRLHLIESNQTGYFDDVEDRLVAILNETRLSRYLGASTGTAQSFDVVTGVPRVPKGQLRPNLSSLRCELGEFEVAEDHVRIPDYDVGMFAIALAMRAGAKEIYLAGLDGFDDERKNARMEAFFVAATRYSQTAGIRLVTVTPSKYATVPHSSVYGWLCS